MEKKTSNAMHSTVMNILENYPVEALMGQLFCPAAFIHDDEAGIARIESLIREHKVGGLTFFHSRASAATNYEKREVASHTDSLQRLTALIRHYQGLSEIPLLISIDAEWGLAMRVEHTPQYPYAITLGAMARTEDPLVYEAARQLGKDLRSVGIDYNLAPVVDINSNPDNPVIGYRSFGDSRENVYQKSLQYCRGLSDAGVLNCLKHFPGHGDTAVDSHLGLPLINKSREELNQTELYPFKKLIEQGVDSVMVGHLAVPALSGEPALPATLSARIIKGVLREELGFKGVVISDALNMHSVSKIYPEKGRLEQKAFEAGNDMLCFSEHIPEGKSMILENTEESLIRESVTRILALKEKAGLFGTAHGKGDPDHEKATAINRRIAAKSMVALKEITREVNTETVVIMGVPEKENGFLATLETGRKVTAIRVSENINSLKLSTNKEVIIAVYPPHIKPLNNFGLSTENLILIQKLTEEHQVTIVLFGNPYSVRAISHPENAANIIFAGQDFREFQETAARILLGELKAEGTLPFKVTGDR